MTACCLVWVQALQATEGQTEELRGHVIIAGFGRVGQIIGQLLAERLIPFVAVDVRMECVQVGKSSILFPAMTSYLSDSQKSRACRNLNKVMCTRAGWEGAGPAGVLWRRRQQRRAAQPGGAPRSLRCHNSRHPW